MIKFFFLFFLSASMTWAQIESERPIQRKLDTQNENEAKSVLLHEAVLELLQQYSTEINLDYPLFKAKLDENFSKYFEALKLKKLDDKFGKQYADDLTEEQKKAFTEGFEAHRENEFRVYAHLNRLLNSYVFKSLEKDSSGEWKAVLLLNLNNERLEKMKTRLFSPEKKQYSKLFILPQINLLGLSWQDMGLDKSSIFSSPVLASWLKWVEENSPVNVEEIVPCTESCPDDFERWIQLPQEEGMHVGPEFINGLWLKISFNLRKLSYQAQINEWIFEWEGSVLLLDANTKVIIGAYHMPAETRTLRGLDQKSLNSVLASSIYRTALDPLNKLVRKIQDSERFTRLSRLIIQGQHNLGDVIYLMELLKKEGAALKLTPQLDLFTQKEAQVLCFYQGEEKSFTDLLSRLKELKLSHRFSVVKEFTGLHHVLRLIAE